MRQKGKGAASVGYELTRIAMLAGYVSFRRPIEGVTLNDWIAKRNPPAWGVRAAIDMLRLMADFTPSLEQKESIALTLAELFPDKDATVLAGEIPDHWERGSWLPIFEAACQVRKRKVAE
jgi:hypothetical protein